jgi:hypothetical protein
VGSGVAVVLLPFCARLTSECLVSKWLLSADRPTDPSCFKNLSVNHYGKILWETITEGVQKYNGAVLKLNSEKILTSLVRELQEIILGCLLTLFIYFFQGGPHLVKFFLLSRKN